MSLSNDFHSLGPQHEIAFALLSLQGPGKDRKKQQTIRFERVRVMRSKVIWGARPTNCATQANVVRGYDLNL